MNGSCIYAWLDSYKKGGWEALRARPLLGRPTWLIRPASMLAELLCGARSFSAGVTGSAAAPPTGRP